MLLFVSRRSILTQAVFVTLCVAVPELVSAAFESGPSRPVARTADGRRVFVANTRDDRLEIFRADGTQLVHESSVRVGLEPVAVNLRHDGEVWVVNHLSDSVSIVDVAASPPRVVRTLLVGDEPGDIVFAGPQRRRAFISAAHRGQHHPRGADLGTPGIGRADVWVFDAEALGSAPGGEAIEVLSLFGDTPRALATDAAGERVYVAVFKSGNRTTTVSAFAICPGGEAAPPCVRDGKTMPGGLPAPNVNIDGAPQPSTGLIVRWDDERAAWLDELGRSWNEAVSIRLPDRDVFVLDAMADPPVEVASYAGVGTVLYAMASHPTSGKVYVAHTEAHNDVRFEPRVRGRLHESRIGILDGDGVQLRRLNPHIDYSVVPSPPGTADKSLATPSALVVSGDGTRLYVAGLGSDAVSVQSVEALESGSNDPAVTPRWDVAGGPVGLLLDEARRRLYVVTYVDPALVVLDLDSGAEVQRLALFDPASASERRGRRWLYDARIMSSNGEASCAGCHVFGGVDDLAWDLGDPNQPVIANPNPRHALISIPEALGTFHYDFHPLKGPLTTQPLQGLATHGPMHWRGDRSGALVGGDAADTHAALSQFNGAFVSLLGGTRVLDAADLADFNDFVFSLVPGPNPIRNLDDSLTPAQAAAKLEFTGADGQACIVCHVIDRGRGLIGTDLSSTSNGESAQALKVPTLRGIYAKVGMFGLFPLRPGFRPSASGDQVRGFGFLHDGSAGVFIQLAFEYIMAFESDLFPIVGQQLTWSGVASEAARLRRELLAARTAAGDAELVVDVTDATGARSWWSADGVQAQPARRHASQVPLASLWEEAERKAAHVTLTAVPPAEGVRRAVDRDGDGAFDLDEAEAGSDPADAQRVPVDCAGDCDFDRAVTVDEIVRGVQIALGVGDLGQCLAFDGNRDQALTVEEIVGAVNAALLGCRKSD